MRPLLAIPTCLLLALTLSATATADELTRIVQQDLRALGYEPGAVDGELSTKTAIAVSKFQAEHELEVTGEITPQLAGIVKAVGRGKYRPALRTTAATTAPASGARRPDAGPAGTTAAARGGSDLQARRQACLEEKMEAARSRKKKKRGFGRLLRAAGRVAGRLGIGSDLAELTRDLYDVNATAEDLSGAAEDLGLTEDEVEECRNPPVEGGRR